MIITVDASISFSIMLGIILSSIIFVNVIVDDAVQYTQAVDYEFEMIARNEVLIYQQLKYNNKSKSVISYVVRNETGQGFDLLPLGSNAGGIKRLVFVEKVGRENVQVFVTR